MTSVLRSRGRAGVWVTAVLLVVAARCLATDVQVVGITPGRSADLVIDGTTITLEVGEETPDGVRLVQANLDSAVVKVDGRTRTLPLVARGEVPADAASTGGTVTLSANASGQFTIQATINGRSVPCLVDTGATLTTLSPSSARHVGLDYRQGVPSRTMTVNGVVDGWRVSLDSVRIRDVMARNVDAIVVENDSLPVVLLGMSFLDRFDMHRQGPTLVLRRRR